MTDVYSPVVTLAWWLVNSGSEYVLSAGLLTISVRSGMARRILIYVIQSFPSGGRVTPSAGRIR